MTGLYPEIEPYDDGMLEVGDGSNLVYWEACGNPHGKPAADPYTAAPARDASTGIAGCSTLIASRVVLFDQRGCGRSTPHASAPDMDLTSNTTSHLIADIELLRRHLDIDRWLVPADHGAAPGARLRPAAT